MSAWDEIETLARGKVASNECDTFGEAIKKVAFEERPDLYTRYRKEPLLPPVTK